MLKLKEGIVMASYDKSYKCCATCINWEGKTKLSSSNKVFCYTDKAKCKKKSYYGETYNYAEPCSGIYWEQKYKDSSKHDNISGADVIGGLLILGTSIVGWAIDHKLKKDQEKKRQAQIEQSNKEWKEVFQKYLIQNPKNQSSPNCEVKKNNLYKDKENKEVKSSTYSRERNRQLTKAIFGNN